MSFFSVNLLAVGAGSFLMLFFSSIGNVFGRSIDVSLYNNSQVHSIVISAYNGRLTAYRNGSEQFSVPDGQVVYVTLRDGKLAVTGVNGFIGSFDGFSVQSSDSSAVVRLRPVTPQAEARNYENRVFLSVDPDRIRLIHRIDEELYIAGVVEAEAGQGKAPEFYKAKAVICRTYLYGHINRHENEGFHLCDEIHCQAYKGQCRSRVIRPAVSATKEIILTDRKESKPILAAYHSNCGGETESAVNAWQTNLPYLIPVVDPYCTSQPNARWQKIITLDDWIQYLMKNGFNPDPNVVTDFSFRQEKRVPDYTVNDFSMFVKQIRSDWQLRSTFFTISVEDDNVVINGRGYGHGVGLCQEGAMEMGRKGFKYGEIIGYYYKHVNLVPVSTLQIEIPVFEIN